MLEEKGVGGGTKYKNLSILCLENGKGSENANGHCFFNNNCSTGK
jgi:hypothetical protein